LDQATAPNIDIVIVHDVGVIQLARGRNLNIHFIERNLN